MTLSTLSTVNINVNLKKIRLHLSIGHIWLKFLSYKTMKRLKRYAV